MQASLYTSFVAEKNVGLIPAIEVAQAALVHNGKRGPGAPWENMVAFYLQSKSVAPKFEYQRVGRPRRKRKRHMESGNSALELLVEDPEGECALDVVRCKIKLMVELSFVHSFHDLHPVDCTSRPPTAVEMMHVFLWCRATLGSECMLGVTFP